MKTFLLFVLLTGASSFVKAQPVVLDTTAEVCDRLKTFGHGCMQVSLYRQANDTLRLYIENCANQRGSFHEFSELDGANQFMSDDNNRWLDYRTWLKKVLYLSSDSDYYCGDINSLLETFQYMLPDPAHTIDYDGSIAVIDYVLQNNRCPDDNSFLLELRKNARAEQLRMWRDTVRDSTKTPIDTGKVTLESLDLQILRGNSDDVASTPVRSAAQIASFIASENPFRNETTLEYALNGASSVMLTIYDELGRLVWGDGRGASLEAGTHVIQIDGSKLPGGTLYARIATGFGEVKTVRLIHIYE